jgi:hypothetical protein
MDSDRPGLDDRIERLMESKGYAARREPSEHAGGKWIYRYASALGGAGTIEIDINYLYRGPLYGVDRMPSAPIGSYRAANVPVLDIHEIVAGKMVACRRTLRASSTSPSRFPIFKAITHFANPALEAAQATSPIVVTADPAECSLQFNP